MMQQLQSSPHQHPCLMGTLGPFVEVEEEEEVVDGGIVIMIAKDLVLARLVCRFALVVSANAQADRGVSVLRLCRLLFCTGSVYGVVQEESKGVSVLQSTRSSSCSLLRRHWRQPFQDPRKQARASQQDSCTFPYVLDLQCCAFRRSLQTLTQTRRW